MSQQIHLAAIVVREGRLMLVRPQIGGEWELPGGPFLPEHEDTDQGMDAILATFGIQAPAIEEDFLDTLYFPAEQGHLVYNLYAASAWSGDPTVPPGTGLGWFDLEELDAIAMNPAVREAVLVAFGLKDAAPQNDAALLAGMQAIMDPPAAAPAVPPPAAPAPPPSDRHAAGLDVLRTLQARDPEASRQNLLRSSPELAGDIIDFALGEVWSHPALDRKTRSLMVVSMLAAIGGRTGALRSHINGALNHGATPEQVVQALRMVAVYAGFPSALAAWEVMEAVFADRQIPRPGRPS